MEVKVFRTGLFRRPSYWISMVIVIGFQILVDGWLTKLSAPIVVPRPQRPRRSENPQLSELRVRAFCEAGHAPTVAQSPSSDSMPTVRPGRRATSRTASSTPGMKEARS